MRSTLADVTAEISRLRSGTRVPGPRTSRTMLPRRTESTMSDMRSTVAEAAALTAAVISLALIPLAVNVDALAALAIAAAVCCSLIAYEPPSVAPSHAEPP